MIQQEIRTFIPDVVEEKATEPETEIVAFDELEEWQQYILLTKLDPNFSQTFFTEYWSDDSL